MYALVDRHRARAGSAPRPTRQASLRKRQSCFAPFDAVNQSVLIVSMAALAAGSLGSGWMSATPAVTI